MNFQNKETARIYLQTLRKMTPEQRLQRAFDLSEFTRQLFLHGLRKRYPDLTPDELHQLYLKQLEKCYNKNY